MANIPSAAKRNRQRLKRRARNLHHLVTMRTYVKRVRAALDESDQAKASGVLAEAVSLIDRVASKGVIKKTTAARKISRLTHAVQKLAASE